MGSGIVLDEQGHVLTNEHVVASATRVHVELEDGRLIAAQVLNADSSVDLAMLRLETVPADLVPARFRPTAPEVGMWVLGVGHPFGLGHSVTVGVIGGLGRDYEDLGRPRSLLPTGAWSFIQTDASVNIGNSGGPLVDDFGRVVGIVTAVRVEGRGIAFAVPTAMALRYVDEVHRFGGLRRPRLGLGVRAEVVRARAGTAQLSLVIHRIHPQSPAEAAGLKVGDEIHHCQPAEAIPGTGWGQENRRPAPHLRRVSELIYCAQLSGVGRTLILGIRRGEEPLRPFDLMLDEQH